MKVGILKKTGLFNRGKEVVRGGEVVKRAAVIADLPLRDGLRVISKESVGG